MEIIKSNLGATPNKLDLYRLTNRNTGHKMSDLPSDVVTVDRWAHTREVDENTGEVMTKLYFEVNGENYGTISQSFMRSFDEFAGIFGDDLDRFECRILHRETKSGRTCILFEGVNVL